MQELSLKHYQKLICNLPYLEQAFETKENTWERSRKHNLLFDDYCNRRFISGKFQLSRGDLFTTAAGGFPEALFSIILWGYPGNMRGNTFERILNNIEDLQATFSGAKRLAAEDYQVLLHRVRNKGMGLSTLSKVLYFLGYSINGHTCVILDSKIIDVINANLFSELSPLVKVNEVNKYEKYIDYLKVMHDVTACGNFCVDQLELFLFVFGKNLKRNNVLVAKPDCSVDI